MPLLERSVAFTLTREAVEGDGLTLEGYAAVFDVPTRINSWEGTFDEQIARGAFRKTIKERTPVMQFDHGRHAMVGSIPLGSIDALREDANGLYVRAQLHDNWLVQPVRDAIASGSVDGMSFRFEPVKDEWRDSKGNVITDPNEVMRRIYGGDPKDVLLRTLREVKVPELGPVVFPAYRDTTVSVRAEDVANVLTDPGVRADLAQLLYTNNANTLVTPSVDERSSDGNDEPCPADEPTAPSLAATDRTRDNLRRLAQRKAVR